MDRCSSPRVVVVVVVNRRIKASVRHTFTRRACRAFHSSLLFSFDDPEKSVLQAFKAVILVLCSCVIIVN